eukprot:gene8708-8889_t
MADLVRILETFSRQKIQAEEKIAAAKQQQELLRKEVDAARANFDVQNLERVESQARSGELLSELQQKQATVLECQRVIESMKQEINSTQHERQQLWRQLLGMREQFVTACADLDCSTRPVLQELQATMMAGHAGAHNATLATSADE